MSTQNLFLEQIAQSLRMDYALVMSQYRQYIKTEKRLFRPRQEQQAQTSQVSKQRTSQKELLLGSLLSDQYRKDLGIQQEWIQKLTEFLTMIHYSFDGYDNQEYIQWQLWREKELSEYEGTQRTEFVRKVLLAFLHQLQQ